MIMDDFQSWLISKNIVLSKTEYIACLKLWTNTKSIGYSLNFVPCVGLMNKRCKSIDDLQKLYNLWSNILEKGPFDKKIAFIIFGALRISFK